MQILANEQRIFDAFAEGSVAAEQVDQAFTRETMDKIVRDKLRKYANARKVARVIVLQPSARI